MRQVIPIISGKGGVGKSTVAVNLAVALAATGAKVALVDGDMYGPSIPTMFGGGEMKADHENRLIPAEKYGVKYVSLGFFLSNPDDPIIWRGPMFNKALKQLFEDVNWGNVDYCIVDMPPGTGDAQISLCQLIPITGAVVVTTPQEVALADVRKSINMLKRVNVEVLGIIENMSAFKTASGEVVDIFGTGGGKDLAEKLAVPLLAEIPLNPEIRTGSDSGKPLAVEQDHEVSRIFRDAALKLIDILDKKLAQAAEVKIIN